jgi:hypothetical protein
MVVGTVERRRNKAPFSLPQAKRPSDIIFFSLLNSVNSSASQKNLCGMQNVDPFAQVSLNIS